MSEFLNGVPHTKHGIDKLELMIKFMPVVEARGSRQINKSLDKLKSFLVEKLKRGITPQENIDLLQGCLDYTRSYAATTERTKAMNYLFNLEFIKA